MTDNKECSTCVYQDGRRTDNTYRCCTPARQRDLSVTDCCIPAEPLRKAQKHAKDATTFMVITNSYIASMKSKSEYWRKEKLNGE
jgi:hypothetical protein